MQDSLVIQTDFLVIGSGLAGLYAALRAARHGKVIIVTKSPLTVSSSAWAQGGVASALGPDDSPLLHAQDTMDAGRGLCDANAVEILTTDGPECVLDLASLGVPFERNERGFDLGLEGSHCRRRILHAVGCATGDAIVQTLCRHVRQCSNIRVVEHTAVVELLSDSERCFGVLGHEMDSGKQVTFLARFVVLATGGAAGLFHSMTNPPTSTGDGITLAYEAGAEIMDMEFIQFHPTVLHSRDGKSFLISESLRGEGAYLVNGGGDRFMLQLDPLAELAPRDVVAWAIHQEMEKTGAECVYLSVKHLNPAFIRQRFSHIYSSCMEWGIDLARDPIPVSPAAHYTIGGVRTDRNGRTSLPGLWACGEVAATGVHGANRLASNSLLECLVFARRAVEDAVQGVSFPVPSPVEGRSSVRRFETAKQCFQPLTRLMTDAVGLVRSEPGLARALADLDKLSELHAGESSKWKTRLIVAKLMAAAALLRTETRGVHRREEFPAAHPNWRKHIVFRKDRETTFPPV